MGCKCLGKDTGEKLERAEQDLTENFGETTSTTKDVNNCGPSSDLPKPEADPPRFNLGHNYLTLDDVSTHLNAKQAWKKEDSEGKKVTGQGVKVVILDSGWYPHPYFEQKYPDVEHKVVDVPVKAFEGAKPKLPQGGTDTDKNGHGTAMVANVLAVAPDADITMIRCVSDKEALKHAISMNPDVISISRGPTWGLGKSSTNDATARLDHLTEMQQIVNSAKDKGILIVDAVGNAGARSQLSLLDGVISVGGIHRADDGTLTASDYTSAYSIAALHDQPIERTVDLKALGKHAADAQDGRCSKCGEALLDKSCAVCRQAVHNVEGQFVVKEGTDVVHPWCDSVYPDRQKQKQIEQLVKAQVPDIGALCGMQGATNYITLPTQPGSELNEGSGENGWGLASGSSCATPQIAGVCALLKQVNKDLTPAQALQLLQQTATPVNQGVSVENVAADGNWSKLVDANAAVSRLLEQL